MLRSPLALLLASLLTATLAQAAPDPALLGCWRSTSIVLHLQDGSKTEDRSGRCTLNFKDDQFESQCGAAKSLASTYKYEIVRPNVYKATMTGSTFSTQLLGSTREYEYQVDGERLLLVTRPPTATPPPPGATVKVESESTRIPCP
ncbi:hypothetical protein LZ009_14425 [Ramlibacter sp. XY19]|uniref:hypothetical protein n=1 Tax=Ramlibacter paludis TaxID=2908000 RepID=UPI0023DC2241|nr:hypothetical protein [Ramlibacter paludis]MCG2593974.1 hypothetical protein [Ramlibacter paludis]